MAIDPIRVSRARRLLGELVAEKIDHTHGGYRTSSQESGLHLGVLCAIAKGREEIQREGGAASYVNVDHVLSAIDWLGILHGVDGRPPWTLLGISLRAQGLSDDQARCVARLVELLKEVNTCRESALTTVSA